MDDIHNRVCCCNQFLRSMVDDNASRFYSTCKPLEDYRLCKDDEEYPEQRRSNESTLKTFCRTDQSYFIKTGDVNNIKSLASSIHNQQFNFTNDAIGTEFYIHTQLMIDPFNNRNISRKCPSLETSPPKLLHGVERLLQGNQTSTRSVKEMNITSLVLPHGFSVCKLSEKNRCTIGVFNMQQEIQKGIFLGLSREKLKAKEFVGQTFHRNFDVTSLLSNPFSWLAYVRRTESCSISNLKLQYGTNIFVKTSKLIGQGEELFICEIDIRSLSFNEDKQVESQSYSNDTEDYNPNGHHCQRCGKVFAYRYYRDKHMKYTRCVDHGDRKYRCHLCPRSFEKRDRLRIHVLHVHEKHRPHQCRLCGKSFSQSSSLNKHTRVHSGERPYECPFCTKAFTASSILRTHIRQHSGEKPFQCRYCGRTFASHAAHDSHVRRTHSALNN